MLNVAIVETRQIQVHHFILFLSLELHLVDPREIRPTLPLVLPCGPPAHNAPQPFSYISYPIRQHFLSL